DGKGEVGMAHYEVRSWVGWHHQMTLSLLALWFLVVENQRTQKKTPAMTVSTLATACSRLLALRELTLEGIVREVNETLRRKEEARIYHYYRKTGRYPPRRGEVTNSTAVSHGTAARDPTDAESLQ